MKYSRKEKYISCSQQKLLTYVNVNGTKAVLHIDKKNQHFYTKEDVTCCYSYVRRFGSKQKPDEGIKFSTCIAFKDSLNLTQDTVKVSCHSKKHKKVYENVHEVIRAKDEHIASKLPQNSDRVPSVLFVGIDSISRLNLIRAMPKTYEFLSNDSETWFPLLGYNKVGDNTFPNLMAIFTGYNITEAYQNCNPKKIGPLDSCRFIWKDYKKFGYITAYGEDETCINTFNYRKKGFTKEPVDYYFKPYMEAAESIGTVKRDTLSYCAGPETSAERILNLAKDFAITYREYKSFGFFWMNTFSHNNLNTPSRMDEKVLNFLKEITEAKILDNSIVVFLSDHGIRFGDIRHTFTGWYEERLPYIYFSFPESFKKKYPEEIANFRTNANRLTTPFDVYITLQHLLVLSGFNFTIKSITSCPFCKSLLTDIDLTRSCETVGIAPHWCTCSGFSNLNSKDSVVLAAANFLVKEIQRNVHKMGGSPKCAKYHLGKVLLSSISDKFSYKNDTYLLISIETIPKAVFEATIHLIKDAKNATTFVIDTSISRLDSYFIHGKCVSDEILKQYCYCK
ncbi:uncharacterized protein LOC123313560 isoform X2 [Coccinella septempunctata]|nr:uncharacterized protein LOC123313560 isoform X2 [Coccinella septempunctata]